MSATDNSDARPDAPAPEGGVLAALPRTRPQRTSARRAAARGKTPESETLASAGKTQGRSAAAETESDKATRKSSSPEPASGKSSSQKKATPTRAAGAQEKKTQGKKTEPRASAARRREGHAKQKPPPPTITEPRAPKQGYEPEEELELGNTVNPPSGMELVESLTDIVSELAGSSLTAGGRLLRDAFSILRRP